jgi:hypothetical protein
MIACGINFSHIFERRMAAFAVYLSVIATNKDLFPSKKWQLKSKKKIRPLGQS